MSTVKRITLSVPVELADDLNYVHRRMGVSKSAFVSSLLVQGVTDLRNLLETLPEHPTPEDVVRFRGASAELAEGRIENFRSQLEE